NTVEGPRADTDLSMCNGNICKTSAEPNRDAGNAAVPNQQIRADPDYRRRDFSRQYSEKGGEILRVRGPEHDLCGPTYAEPSLPAYWCIRDQPAAHRRKLC